MQQLKKGITLQGGKYKIEKVLGQGGFGITYLATQELLDRKVCIKEFFFKDSCGRNLKGEVTLGTVSNKVLVARFLNKFIKEARMLSQLEHPNIIRVLDVFKENNTAYYVMDFIEGCSLEDIVRTKGALSESVAIDYIKQVANALDYIHKRNLNHLDIKPANIMIRKCDNKAILIDFGVSKQYDSAGDQTSTTPVGISYGYAPIEQYRPGGVSEFSPQVDIYSLGATLYKILTGHIPPQAMEILSDGFPDIIDKFSPKIKDLIKQSMSVRKQDRPDSISSFISYLKNDKTKQVKGHTTTYPYSESDQLAQIYFEKAESIEMNEDSEPEDSFLFYLKAAELGHVKSQIEIADSYISGSGTQKDDKKAFEWYKKAAESEDVEALNCLAECYNEGIGTKINKINAFKLYNKALTLLLKDTEKGDTFAMERVLQYYKKGHGCAKDPQQVFAWTQRIADKNNSKEYLAKLAFYYEVGYGTNIDTDKSSELYTKIIETSEAEELYDIGEKFACDDDKKVKEQAHKWFSFAAEKGDAEVTKYIAINYDGGYSVEEDKQRAIFFYEIAAKLGNVEAMVHLGFKYYTEEECRNYAKAIQWWQKALELKNTDDFQKIDWIEEKSILEHMAHIYKYGGYGIVKNRSEAQKLELHAKELSK